MVVRIVGTNAEEAGRLLTEARFETARQPRRGGEQGRRRGRGRRRHEHPRRPRHAARRPGHHRARGRVPRPPDASSTGPGRGRHDPEQGRPDGASTAGSRCSTRSPRRSSATGANTSCIFVPAAGAPDAILEAVGAGIGTIFCITEGIPALDMLQVVEVVRPGRRPADRPELPGRDVARPGQGRHHPGLDPPRPAGSASCRRSGTLTYEAVQAMTDAGHRPVDLRRHRRRPDHRDDLPRHPPAVRGGPRDRRDRAHRRDRRLGRGGGGGLGRRAPAGRADGRLHRRPDGARGQADGPRRGDHLGGSGDGGRQDRRARGGRASASPSRRPSCRRSSAPPATATRLAAVGALMELVAGDAPTILVAISTDDWPGSPTAADSQPTCRSEPGSTRPGSTCSARPSGR